MSGNPLKTGRNVWVGFSDDKPHWDKHAERSREHGYCVCKTRAAARALYEDVRPMRLVPVRKPKAKRSTR